MCRCDCCDYRIMCGGLNFLSPVEVGEMGVFNVSNDFCEDYILMLLTSLARFDASFLSNS